MLSAEFRSSVREQYSTTGNLEARITLHRKNSTSPQTWTHWVFDRIVEHTTASSHILELGCGTGQLWLHNADRIPSRWQLTLTDLSPGMLEATRKSLPSELEGHCEFGVADAAATGLPSATFDAVVANHMLYHVPDRKAAYREVKRLLKPNGVFFATTNGCANLKEFKEPALLEILYPHGKLVNPVFALEGSDQWFYLENGEAELKNYFRSVQRIDFVDALRISDIEDLVRYHQSYVNLSVIQCESVADYYEARRTSDNTIHITKSVGIFVCRV